MELPIEVLVYLFEYLPGSDRASAGLTCRLWYEAANDKRFLRTKYVAFHKIVLDDEPSPLDIFEHSNVEFTNFLFQELEINSKLNKFWENIGHSIKSLTIRNCDVCEKVFMYLLNCCSNLEELKVLSCKELFMSGRLMEGNVKGLNTDSLASLKLLSLAGNRYLSDALFNRFIATAPLLEELDLSSCAVSFHSGLYKKFYPRGVDADLESLKPSESVLTFHFILQFVILRAKFLNRLSFSDTLIDGTSLKLLSEASGLKLKSLEVHSCDQLTNVGIISLATHQTCLKELDIGLCTRVTDVSLVQICNNLVNLEYLNIQRCRAVTDLGIKELHKLKRLVSLNISQCEFITSDGFEKGVCPKTNPTLKELTINSLNLDQQSIILLSERLPNLRYLDVSYCFNAVTDVSIQVIFKNQIWLQYLKLSHCDKVSDAGLTGMGKVQQVDEDDECTPIMNTIAEPSYRIHLGSRAEEEIVRDTQRKRDIMKMCENISTYVYSGYSLARLKGLKILDVSGCNKITDVSLTYAFNFNELIHLNMSKCQQITHEGIDYLVRNCPSIEYYNLTDCYNLNDEAVAKIVKGLRRLKNLELRGCNQLTDKSLESIRANCEKLKVLDVQGCRNMSPELACSLGNLSTLHTVLMSKPGPYISDGVKNRLPMPPSLPSLMRLFRLH